MEPVKVEAADIRKGLVKITNRYDFLNLDSLNASYSILLNGRVIGSGGIPPVDIKAQSSGTVKIPFCFPANPKPGAEYFLCLSFTLPADTIWAKAGHELAWAQLPLPVAPKKTAAKKVSFGKSSAVDAIESDVMIAVNGARFKIVFDKVKGAITEWNFEDMPLLVNGPLLNFWRAPIDNDGVGGGHGFAKEWRDAGYHEMMHRCDGITLKESNGAAIVTVKSRIAPPIYRHGFLAEYVYTITPDGAISMAVSGKPVGEKLPHLPRIGLQMTLPDDLDTARWYGLGPGEAYIDSKAAQRAGVYSCPVEELYTPYVFPQENGNREDVRWVSLSNRHGMGLCAIGAPLFNFTAQYFSTDDLDKAKHSYDLVPRDEISLSLDYRQCGIGSGSCGPYAFEQYRIPAEAFKFGLSLRPFMAGEASEENLWMLSR